MASVRAATAQDAVACEAIVVGLPDFFTDDVPDKVRSDPGGGGAQSTGSPQASLHGRGSGVAAPNVVGMAFEGAKRGKRAWIGEDWVADRVDWAFAEARACVQKQPWATVVLAQVAVEVLLSGVVHALTRLQEPAMRRWIEGLRVETLTRNEETDLLDALIARTGETIKGDEEVWLGFREHVERRHHFIHRAEQPSVEEAKSSLLACHRFCDRLMTLFEEQVNKNIRPTLALTIASASPTSRCALASSRQVRR